MNPKYHISLELAKIIDDLHKKRAIKRKSEYWWHIYKTPEYCAQQNNLLLGKPINSGLANDYPAYHIGELFELHYKLNGNYPKAIMDAAPKDMANVLGELYVHKMRTLS